MTRRKRSETRSFPNLYREGQRRSIASKIINESMKAASVPADSHWLEIKAEWVRAASKLCRTKATNSPPRTDTKIRVSLIISCLGSTDCSHVIGLWTTDGGEGAPIVDSAVTSRGSGCESGHLAWQISRDLIAPSWHPVDNAAETKTISIARCVYQKTACSYTNSMTNKCQLTQRGTEGCQGSLRT